MPKNSLLLITSAAALLPTLAMGLVGIHWNVTTGSAVTSDLTDITYPFSIADSPHKTGYYFAQQFFFTGQSHGGYAGLQPRPDANGKPVIHAAFSSFINGTTFNDSNCTPGADGGPGVSCAVEFSAPYSDAYEIEVINVQGTTQWRGTVVDTTTAKRVHIGSWTLPAVTGGIQASSAGFIEYYLGSTCPTLPYTSMIFGVPKTTRVGAVGHLGDAYEYGDCVGKVAFKSHRTVGQGVAVSVGFK